VGIERPTAALVERYQAPLEFVGRGARGSPCLADPRLGESLEGLPVPQDRFDLGVELGSARRTEIRLEVAGQGAPWRRAQV
jgi:hypothetical protein